MRQVSQVFQFLRDSGTKLTRGGRQPFLRPFAVLLLRSVPKIAVLRISHFILPANSLNSILEHQRPFRLSLKDCDVIDFASSVPATGLTSSTITGLELDRSRFHEPDGYSAASACASLLELLDLGQLAIEVDRPLPNAPDENRWAAKILDEDVVDVISSRMRGLKLLSLRGSELVNDELLRRLGPVCGKLTSLDLAGSGVTDAGVEIALESSPLLDRLILRRCKLTTRTLGMVCRHRTLRSLHLFSVPGIPLEDLLTLAESGTLKYVRVYAVAFIPESQPLGWGNAPLMRRVKGLLWERRGIRLEYFSREDVWRTVNLDA